MVGSVHKEYLMAINQLTEILIRAGDHEHAFSNCLSAIPIAAQLKGFDNLETVRCHMQLASLYHVKKQYTAAVNHMTAAKYVVQLMGGKQHPELVNNFIKLGNLYCEVGSWEVGIKCLEEAKKRTETSNPLKHSDICRDLAEMMAKLRLFQHASELQKQAFLICKSFLGDEHERTVSLKSTLELYLRAFGEQIQLEKKLAEEGSKRMAEVSAKQAQESWTVPATTTSNKKKSNKPKKK